MNARTIKKALTEGGWRQFDGAEGFKIEKERNKPYWTVSYHADGRVTGHEDVGYTQQQAEEMYRYLQQAGFFVMELMPERHWITGSKIGFERYHRGNFKVSGI